MAAPAVPAALPKVQASYKIDVDTKQTIDLMSNALESEKSAVLARAIKLLAERHRDDLHAYLDRARVAIDSGGDWAVAEAVTGKKRSRAYVGGRVRQEESKRRK